jgi:hypothetical protein
MATSRAPKIVPAADRKMSNISAIPLAAFASSVPVIASVTFRSAGSEDGDDCGTGTLLLIEGLLYETSQSD